MANTGHFCILANSTRVADELASRLSRWVEEHPDLKNLDIEGEHATRLVAGTIDRLTPEAFRTFFRDQCEGVGLGWGAVRVFVIDSTYGGGWQELSLEG